MRANLRSHHEAQLSQQRRRMTEEVLLPLSRLLNIEHRRVTRNTTPRRWSWPSCKIYLHVLTDLLFQPLSIYLAVYYLNLNYSVYINLNGICMVHNLIIHCMTDFHYVCYLYHWTLKLPIIFMITIKKVSV
jgi:hypothetical protein